jgi:hypothetical protein
VECLANDRPFKVRAGRSELSQYVERNCDSIATHPTDAAPMQIF